MKSTEALEPQYDADELLPEHEFDYRNARPNRFATQMLRNPLTVELEPGVAAVYPDATAVNEALRFPIRIAKDFIAHS